MGRILSSVLKQELAKLDKDPISHKTSMETLKSYMKDLDANAISLFVAQISETKETGSEPGQFTVSLFEDLARAQGVKIWPHMEGMMQVIIRTLACSGGSFHIHQACSKVVSAIARYGIDPGTPRDKKRNMIHSLCEPLCDSLLDSQAHLALGAAVCMKALVDCSNWRFASDEMVNKVCQNVAVALEATSSETNSHMALAMALAKHNPFIVEAYARLLVHSGLRILDLGVAEVNSEKRLLAIQMLNFLMKNLDPKSMYSEAELILREMEKCRKDPMHFVKMAAHETMRTAKRLIGDDTLKLDNAACDSYSGSNFGTEICRTPVSAKEGSIKSRTDDSQSLYRSGFDQWSVNRKHEGCVAVHSKEQEDDLFSGVTGGTIVAGSPLVPYADYTNGIHVSPQSPRDGYLQNAMACQIPRSRVEDDDFDILSHRSDLNGEFRRMSVSKSSRKNAQEHSEDGYPRHHRHGFVQDPFDELIENREQRSDDSSSTHDSPTTSTSTNTSDNTCEELRADEKSEVKVAMEATKGRKQGRGKSVCRLGVGFFSMAVAGLASFMWVCVHDDMGVPHLVPT